MSELAVMHVGNKSEQCRATCSAMNRRLAARGLTDRKVRMYEDEMTLTPEVHKSMVTCAWALGASEQTLAEMKREKSVPIGVQRIIRSPGSRDTGQLQLGQRRIAHLRKQRKQRAERARNKSGRPVAVRAFASFIGTTERPSGSNGNPANISKWEAEFGFGRVPWCGISCGHFLRRAGVKGVTSRIASVALIEDDAKAGRGPFRSWTTGRGDVRPGDLVVIGGRGVHVEMVEKVLSGGTIQTIGGNTSPGHSGSQANGGGVWRRTRGAGAIRGVARVNFP